MIYSVSELNMASKQLLESTFGLVWVKGELSNFSCPQSGHWYFSLKDNQAQIKCAMFRGANTHLLMKPTDGLNVLVLASVSLYPGRGDYQLIVQKLESSGEGQLRQAFDQLKSKLAAQGLFDAQYKKNLPTFPARIGIITSPTGAAIQDIIAVLKRRYPISELYIYPCQVQGTQAGADIVSSIKLANKHNICEILILARGGGSLEDLWPFNEEKVAHAIFESILPIVSGVGHETDITIADFVADARAPTPSAAAEMISPDLSLMRNTTLAFASRLKHTIYTVFQIYAQKIDYLEKRLLSPKQILDKNKKKMDHIQQRLESSFRQHLKNKKNHFEKLAYALAMVNPYATLNRGYSMVQKETKVIYRINDLNMGDLLTIRMTDGWIQASVVELMQLSEQSSLY